MGVLYVMKDIYSVPSGEDIFYPNYHANFKYFACDESKKHLSDFITVEEIRTWDAETPVLISAQTGKGKNYFIQHSLIRMVHNDNKKSVFKNDRILLLSNRVALNRQEKISLADSLKDLGYDEPSKAIDDFSDSGIDKRLIDLGIVTVCSYHQFYNNSEIQHHNFRYVICDECHFFTSDSIFNPYTAEILKTIVKNFSNSIRIYMSATLEETFEPIMQIEKFYYDYHKIDYCYYYFQRNYDYIENIFVYDNFQQVTEKITESRSDKWLFFVSSKSSGNKLLEDLKNREISTTFLTAESKDCDSNSDEHKTYSSIVENENFNQTVLISTAVLDNGINIKDKAVKNIVIDVFDRVQFLQMLGRVRVLDNFKINLYIRNYTETDLKNFLFNDLKELTARLELELIPQKNQNRFFDRTMHTNSPHFDVRKMFYTVSKGKNTLKSKVKYNLCAIYKLIDRISTFISVLKIQNPDFNIVPENFGELRTLRRRIFERFSSNLHSYLIDNIKWKILQILASEEEKSVELENQHRDSLKYSFLSYTYCFQILNFLKKSIQNNHLKNGFFVSPDFSMNSETEFQNSIYLKSLNDQLQHYESILDLVGQDYPSVEQQLHWLEKSSWENIHFLNKKDLILLSEKTLEEILTEYSISAQEYKKNISEKQKYTTFRNFDLLQNKGTLVKNISESYQRIFSLIKEKFGFTKPKEMENAIPLKNESYKLVTVRDNKRESQKMWYLFVKSE